MYKSTISYFGLKTRVERMRNLRMKFNLLNTLYKRPAIKILSLQSFSQTQK